MRGIREAIANLAVLAGLALISLGAWWLLPAAGLLVGGLGLIAVGCLLAWSGNARP